MALINFNKSVTCDAISQINDKNVVLMTANIPQRGGISISKSISDREVYFLHQEECDADYEEFNKKVEDIAKNLE